MKLSVLACVIGVISLVSLNKKPLCALFDIVIGQGYRILKFCWNPLNFSMA